MSTMLAVLFLMVTSRGAGRPSLRRQFAAAFALRGAKKPTCSGGRSRLRSARASRAPGEATGRKTVATGAAGALPMIDAGVRAAHVRGAGRRSAWANSAIGARQAGQVL